MNIALQILMSLVFAATAPKNNDAKKLDVATAFLRGQDMYQMPVEKVVVYELLDKTTTSTGEIYVAGGKFRWDTHTPEKSMVLYDGKILWAVQYPDKDLGGPTQVTKSRIDAKAKDQLLVKILTDKARFSTKFKITDKKTADGMTVYSLEPLKEDPTIRKFSAGLNAKSGKLIELSYTDEVGNLTTIKILEKYKKPADVKMFKPNLPSDAQVNEL
jgi:outer membrane lipoprotein-sorting protein